MARRQQTGHRQGPDQNEVEDCCRKQRNAESAHEELFGGSLKAWVGRDSGRR